MKKLIREIKKESIEFKIYQINQTILSIILPFDKLIISKQIKI